MDILRRLNAAANGDLQRTEKRLLEVVSMLTGLVKGLECDPKIKSGTDAGTGKGKGGR